MSLTPDGYSGHIIDHSLQFLSDSAMARWCESPRVAVTATHEFMATDSAGHPVTDLVNGCILQILPDGTLLTPDRRRITPREKPTPCSANGHRPRSGCKTSCASPNGSPASSTSGEECRAKAWTAPDSSEWPTPRKDASSRATPGNRPHKAPKSHRQTHSRRRPHIFRQPADKRITHVAIYDRDGEYIHASQMVRRNSLRKDSPLYLPLHIITMRRTEGKSFPVGRIL